MASEIGTVTVYINGSPILSLPGATIKLGGKNETELNTDQGVVLSTSEFTHGEVKVTVPITDIDTIENLRFVKGVSLEWESADNDVVYKMADTRAKMAGDWELKKGGTECTFFGQAAKPG